MSNNGNGHGDVVRLSVPASLEYIRIVRLTTSAIATRLGFDVDEIENLRIAVDELASSVLDAAGDGELALTYSTAAGELTIEGTAKAQGPGDLDVDQLSAQILNAVCDKYELRAVDGSVRFSCVRQLPAE
jgi:serine/threonine-protein kinase RsbW